MCEPTSKEDRFRDGWLIDLPDDCKYAGYQMYVSSYFVYCPNRRFLCITKGKQDFLYELYKKEREPGKRYPRYKLTFEELADAFSIHSAQFGVSDSLPYVLAYCKDYANNGTRSAGVVLGCSYYIGQVDETWLYLDDVRSGYIERRRLKSNGVRVIKHLASEDVEATKQMVCRLVELQRRKSMIDECRIEIPRMQRLRHKTWLSDQTYSEVQKRLNEINVLIDADIKADEQEIAQIEKYLKGE